MSDISADKLVAAYVRLRTRRQEVLKAFEAEDADLKMQQDMISERLLEICKEVGADSLKTPYGTVSRTTKTRYWTNDWGAMYDFVITHKAPELLEQRIHQSNIKNFLEEHPDVLPPGLNEIGRAHV